MNTESETAVPQPPAARRPGLTLQIWRALAASLMSPPAPPSVPAQPGVAPWWEERHREAEESEFWRLLGRLDEKQRHEVIDTVKFQLWLQRWRNQERDLPSFQVIRGALLAATFDARMMLARFWL